MGNKKRKKLELKKETISNLSKFEQGLIIGGYEPASTHAWWDTICQIRSFFDVTQCDDKYCDTQYDSCYCTLDRLKDNNCNDSTIVVC